ncbi:hypothetical protein [Paenibacillus sp. IHBB 3054]|uniref:hypothetical protein n=1 Tax=Paenibacillus sp. IHBB 3054 TaxID=3425689 RepID=UPI003F67B1FC
MTINVPDEIKDLELMKLLKNYSTGDRSWKEDGVSKKEKEACEILHNNLTNLINNVFVPILNRATSRELELFTMHDKNHGMKVAQLMWNILSLEKRELINPLK